MNNFFEFIDHKDLFHIRYQKDCPHKFRNLADIDPKLADMVGGHILVGNIEMCTYGVNKGHKCCEENCPRRK